MHGRVHRPGAALPRRRRASRRPRRTAAGAPGRARAASAHSARKAPSCSSRARGDELREPRARCPPGRRSPRDGRARRAGRSWDHDPRRPPRTVTRRYPGSSTSAAADSYARCTASSDGERPERVGCREDLHVERAVPAGADGARATISAERPSGSGTARTPGTGSGSSSATWSPVMRSTTRTSASSGLVAEVERVHHDPDVGRAGRRRGARAHRRARSTKPAVSRWEGWIGSKPEAHARLAGGRRRAPEAVDDDRPPFRFRATAERSAQAEHALGRRSAARRRIDAQIASRRSSGSGGPSIPGIASCRNDGTVGTQFDTVEPCIAQSGDGRCVVLGQLRTPTGRSRRSLRPRMRRRRRRTRR